jgi:hypothetical protein
MDWLDLLPRASLPRPILQAASFAMTAVAPRPPEVRTALRQGLQQNNRVGRDHSVLTPSLPRKSRRSLEAHSRHWLFHGTRHRSGPITAAPSCGSTLSPFGNHFVPGQTRLRSSSIDLALLEVLSFDCEIQPEHGFALKPSMCADHPTVARSKTAVRGTHHSSTVRATPATTRR